MNEAVKKALAKKGKFTREERNALFEEIYHNDDVDFEDKIKVLKKERPNAVVDYVLEYVNYEFGGEASTFHLDPWDIPVPFGFNVVILPSRVVQPELSGGLIVPEEVMQMEYIHNTEGYVVAVAELAYKDREDGAEWVGEYPQLGDRVCYQKIGHTTEYINNVELKFVPDEHVARGLLAPGTKTTKYLHTQGIKDLKDALGQSTIVEPEKPSIII